MDWDGVRTFLAVARTGRVSAAARELGVQHTTVSRRLDSLEQQLGVTLFYRTAQGYRLTPQGEDALASARDMERAAFALGSEARARAGSTAGRVRVALLPEMASHWLAPALPRFREQHPRIELQLRTGIHLLDLSRGEADIAVRAPRPRHSGLATLSLGPAPTGLYVARTIVGRKRPWIADARSASGIPLLVYEDQYSVLQSAEWFRPVLEAGTVVLTSNSTETLLAAARAGAGFAVLPRFVARPYKQLVAVSDDLHNGHLWLTTHPEFRRDPKIRVVMTFLKEIGGELAGWHLTRSRAI